MYSVHGFPSVHERVLASISIVALVVGIAGGSLALPPVAVGSNQNDNGNRCGNGNVQTGEQCDDGNDIDEDDCSNQCVAQSMETCLLNPSLYWDQESDTCTAEYQVCTDPDGGADLFTAAHTFGFRRQNAGPEDARIRTGGRDACLDAQTLREHSCSDTYFITTSDVICPYGCFADTCLPPPTSFCGDGTTDAGEQCDDGNATDGDGCSAVCTEEVREISIQGRLVDALTGQPVEDARLMSAYAFQPANVVTDANGEFSYAVRTDFMITEGAEQGTSDDGGSWYFSNGCYQSIALSVRSDGANGYVLTKNFFDQEEVDVPLGVVGTVDVGEVPLYPSANIAVTSDVPIGYDVHFQYKNLEGTNGPGQGCGPFGFSNECSTEYSLNDALPVDYDVYLKLWNEQSGAYQTPVFHTPIVAMCSTVHLDYADGVARWSFCGNGTRESVEQCDDGNTDDGDGCSNLCELSEVHLIDNGDPGFSVTNGWTYQTAQGYQSDVHHAPKGNGSRKATWTFPVRSGTYRVSATWSHYWNRATDAPFIIADGTASLGTVRINQELAPDDLQSHGASWEDLGTFNVSGTSLTVTLSNNANEYVIADAIRIERLPTVPVCGNGTTEEGEQCDDGNATDWDGCSAQCVAGPLLGDVSLNGTFSSTDTSLASRHVKGIELLTGDALLAADADQDGVITLADVLLISSIAVGKITLPAVFGDVSGDGAFSVDDGALMPGIVAQPQQFSTRQRTLADVDFNQILDQRDVDLVIAAIAGQVTLPVLCGNGVLDPGWGEQCDDGNAVDGDGCSAQCVVETLPACGDGTAAGDALCDVDGQDPAESARDDEPASTPAPATVTPSTPTQPVVSTSGGSSTQSGGRRGRSGLFGGFATLAGGSGSIAPGAFGGSLPLSALTRTQKITICRIQKRQPAFTDAVLGRLAVRLTQRWKWTLPQAQSALVSQTICK